MRKTSLLIFAMMMALLLFVAAPDVPETAVKAQGTNLLKNPGFELPAGADGNAHEWNRWHQNSPESDLINRDCTAGYYVLPKWNVEGNSALVHSGSSSQQVGNSFDTWHGGVWQNVPATPGVTYRFTFYARGRGSNEQFPAPSDTSLQIGVRAGIDPSGSGIWHNNSVVWGSAANPHDQWQQVSVQATATSNQITVFTAANWVRPGVFQCRAHLDVWFDSAELVALGPPATNTPPPPPPPPPATNTPLPPTATFTPEFTPTPTETPTITPSPTPTGGRVCVNAFADENGNGVRDPGEGYMAGVTFTVASSELRVGEAISAGTDIPFCFEGVPPGAYQITQIVPGALEMTTAASATVTVVEGQTIGLEFGSRVATRPEISSTATSSPDTVASNIELPTAVAPTPVPPGADATSSPSPLVWAGLAAMVAAVLLLGVLLFVVLRRT